MELANPSRQHNFSLIMQDTKWIVGYCLVMLAALLHLLGKPYMKWAFVRVWLFLFSTNLYVALGLPSLLGDTYREALFEKSIYACIPVVMVEMMMYTFLTVVLADRLTSEHMKSKICGFSLSKFLGNCITARPAVIPLVNSVDYSVVYPVIYVTVATCSALYSTNPANWFAQSILLMINRRDLIKLNGVSKLNFIYTIALVLFPLKGLWVSFMYACQLSTERWNTSTSDKVFAAQTVMRVFSALYLMFIVRKSGCIETATVDGPEDEKETNDDKVVSNVEILIQFFMGLLPVTLF